MDTASLPKKISRIMVCAISVLLIGMWSSIELIRRSLNQQGLDASIRDVTQNLDSLHDQLRTIARDYNNWGDVYLAALRNDYNFIADNYAITAINGDIFDQVTMFDGPFTDTISWSKDGSRTPKFVPANEQAEEQIRRRVSEQTPGARETLDFFRFDDGKLRLMSASYLLPDTVDALQKIDLGHLPIAVLSKVVRDSDLEDISAASNVTDLHISSRPFDAPAYKSLSDYNGIPVSFLIWTPPHPGNHLVVTVLPLLILVTAAFVIITIFAKLLLNRYTDELKSREIGAMMLARTDSLGGLPNRLAFLEHTEYLDLNLPVNLALVVMDLNGFKNINDVAGHVCGDFIIREFSRRLESVTGQDVFAARVGGDEFVVSIRSESSIEDRLTQVVRAIIGLLEAPFIHQAFTYDLTVSFGTAINDGTAHSAKELFRRADLAMYHAKDSFSNSVCAYSIEMDKATKENRDIERCLREAIKTGSEFSLVYQPIVDSKSGCIVKAEALARWTNAELGAISPERFISVAEQSGLMPALGRLLLNRICADMAMSTALKICVNISPKQIAMPNFVGEFMQSLLYNQIDPGRIEVELTEGIVVQDAGFVSQHLARIQGYGVSTSLDDFGTGFSSIAYLQQMPFETLKIDRSFVATFVTNPSHCEIVQSIIALGHSLGKEIIGEGVETVEQAAALEKLGCDLQQGYFFGRPVPMALLLDQVRGNVFDLGAAVA